MPTITFIDDEHRPIDLYVRALRQSGFSVEHLDTVALALKHIKETDSPSDLYIIDLMMPSGDALDLEKAGFGLTSGIELHRILRQAGAMAETRPESGIEIHRHLRQRFSSVPVIILTSVSNPEIINVIPFDKFTRREAKIDVLPFELVEKVKAFLKHE